MADDMRPSSWNPVKLRRGVMDAACLETALIFIAIRLASAPASVPGPVKPTGGAIVALLAFFLLILPAWLLAWANRGPLLALVLVAVAGAVCVALLVALAM